MTETTHDSAIVMELGSDKSQAVFSNSLREDSIRDLINDVKTKGEETRKENDRVALLLMQGNAASMRKMTHVIDGIEVTTRTSIPSKLRAATIKEIEDIERSEDLSLMTDVFAEFMSKVSLDVTDPKDWIRFDEECGLLPKVALTVLKQTLQKGLRPESMNNFRKE